MPDVPPYATWDADRLLREGISPVLALEARIANAEWKARDWRACAPDAALIYEVEAATWRDALAIITASQRLSDIDAVANQSKP